jgi:lycopene beta-cyclase
MNNNSLKDYDNQLQNYIENHLNIKDYKITYMKKKVLYHYFILKPMIKKINKYWYRRGND